MTKTKAAILGVGLVALAVALTLFAWPASAGASSTEANLIFIHHSCGENWLDDGLCQALNESGYHVADTTYGWTGSGSYDYGSSTDTSDWPTWFTDTVMEMVYDEMDAMTAGNTLPAALGENTIIMFKSCYPCSDVGSSITDEQAIYNSLLPYMEAHADKMFILVTPPPMLSISYPLKTRELCNWLTDRDAGWLKDLTTGNVFVFDFYNVLTHPNAHHYMSGGVETHTVVPGYNTLYYPTGGDNHPNATGNLKAAQEFIGLLNAWYAEFMGGAGRTLYQQTNSKITYLGPWKTASDASASGGSFCWTSSPGAAASVTFTGTEVALLSKTGPNRGIALVSLDGGEAEEVDFYSATYLQRRAVYEKEELTDEAHTLTIEWARLKNASATDYLLPIDALQIMGSLTQAPPTARYEQDDELLEYAGTWSTATTSTASGGSFCWAATEGAAVSVEFEGSHLSLVAKTGPTRGIALVSLDGGEYEEVDLYSPTYLDQQRIYSTGLLTDTVHTLTVSWAGVKNPAATGFQVMVDAFDVLGELTEADPPPPVPTRYEQADPKLTYLGPWKTASDSGNSGGSFCWTASPGAAATASFTGTAVALFAKTGPARGIALVSLDGAAAEEVDFYGATYLQRQVVYEKEGLADEAHTLTIEWSGTKNASATSYTILLDALQIMGSLTQAPPTTRYEQDDELLAEAGAWYTATTSAASGGSFCWAATEGAAVNVEFEGTHLSLLAKTGPTRGIALVSLDGAPYQEVDLYSSTYLDQQLVYSTGLLPDTFHTLTVSWAGVKNPDAISYQIVLDAFDVLGELTEADPPPPVPTRYEQSDPKVTYLGPWKTATDPGNSGGSFCWTASPGAAASVSFTGTAVTLFSKTGPNRGIALVSVDGGTAEEVDFYSSSYLQRQAVYEKTGLTDEAHTLTVEWAGLKNESASGYLIPIDALQIMGSLTQAPATTRYEQSHALLVYVGSWFTATTSAASGGSFRWANSSGATVSLSFVGTHLSLVARTGPARGIAMVSLDGGPVVELDLYSSTYLDQQRVYSTGLQGDTVHTLTITWSGTRNPAATSNLILVDAFDVLGELTAVE